MRKRHLLWLGLVLFTRTVWSLPAGYLTEQPAEGDFALVAQSSQALIRTDSDDHKGLLRAVRSLQQDIHKVSGRQLSISHTEQAPQMLIIGSLDNSDLVNQLVAAGKLDVSAIRGKWEAYQIQTVRQPLPGVEQALVIVGSDKRGAIYGVYDLAETIGVSPWYWWADVPVIKREQLHIKADTLITDAPKVKYRGIFLNDEHPALSNWTAEKFGGYNSQFYVHVFELLLRLKANFLWPAMWNNAFADDDPLNPILADEMGIVMSNSHHEPMMRADKEWNRYGEGPWEYSTNRDNIYQFWQEGARRHKELESIFTLGMRGQEDEPMSEGENIGLLEQVVADQREILRNTFTDTDISEVPQVWALYKEVQGFYERGMRVPDDVTLLWADDNFGNIRRLPTADERGREGGAGVYYHFDYVGGPRSYRWINTVPMAKIWEQMNLAWQYQADRIWIVNVGDLKPMEFPIDFFLRMAWNPEDFRADNLQQFAIDWAAQQFGKKHAQTVAELIQGYTRHNGRRKPEAVEPDTYSIFHYDEAGRISTELAQLVEKSDLVEQQLAAQQQDAYVQLVSHPLKATQAVFELNRAVAMNRLHGEQGRVSTNYWAEQVRYWFHQDAQLTEKYHGLGEGRWNHMMSQPHIGYTYWRNPPANLMPVVSVAEPMEVADMGVAPEGSDHSWPISEYQGQTLSLDTFYPHGQAERYIEVFNKGTQPFEFKARAVADWITLSQTQGNIEQQQKIRVSIDWDKTPAGHSQGEVVIQGTGWGAAHIKVSAYKPADKPQGFVEADGYISLEAASAKVVGNRDGAYWQEIPGHGRTHSSVSAVTGQDMEITDLSAAPYLQYPLYFHSTGEFELHAIVAPTLDFVPDRGLRFAVALGEEKPQIVDILADNSQRAWEQSVLDGVRRASHKLQVEKPGQYQLRVYLVDPGAVLQKLVIDTGDLRDSYLGPPQSQFVR
ncbi:glycosyl hydrolase 115 family protein [Lacimicrobium alkaliphilum]|uniref:Glycosyl hydrolase n=1 Tax=Lacimicrobium alkaliphilum TaxID=1526571 RepID=A0A0U3B4C2_9ALTE|nr:glycosyl hydrolase 115 family protein [Lacimicrobium alkaliphilum]ALS99904.1 glycosyl hydrolase [Lacimicrobium alkaliphilum]